MPPPQDPSDDLLVSSALAGDVRAFDALIRRHEARVLRVLRYLGVPYTDREDVAQDVFLRVFRHLKGYRPGRSFEAWIYQVSVNSAHDWREQARRLQADEAPWPEGLGEVHADPNAPDPSRADLARRLEAALATLSERERDVFVLKEIEGLETAGVAKALGITSITVRRHLGLAKDRLRKALG